MGAGPGCASARPGLTRRTPLPTSLRILTYYQMWGPLFHQSQEPLIRETSKSQSHLHFKHRRKKTKLPTNIQSMTNTIFAIRFTEIANKNPSLILTYKLVLLLGGVNGSHFHRWNPLLIYGHNSGKIQIPN